MLSRFPVSQNMSVSMLSDKMFISTLYCRSVSWGSEMVEMVLRSPACSNTSSLPSTIETIHNFERGCSSENSGQLTSPRLHCSTAAEPCRALTAVCTMKQIAKFIFADEQHFECSGNQPHVHCTKYLTKSSRREYFTILFTVSIKWCQVKMHVNNTFNHFLCYFFAGS